MWEAIGDLAWLGLATVVLYKLWPTITDILKRDGTSIKIGSLELALPQATRAIGKDVTDIQERLSNLETLIGENTKKGHEQSLPTQSDHTQRLLWVDDFPSNNAFLIDHLKERGIEIEISLGTDDAIKRIGRNNFSAVITDLGRIEDGVDNPLAGLDLIERIREKEISIPVLVFAGQRGLQHRQQLISAGAEGVTASGVDVMTFIEKHIQ